MNRYPCALAALSLFAACAQHEQAPLAAADANNSVLPAAGCAGGSCPQVAQALPLGGCWRTHYMLDVTIGANSPVTLPMSFDTGSWALGVSLSTCTGCNVSPGYSPPTGVQVSSEDSTESYGTGAYGFTGQLYRDRVSLADGTQAEMRFVGIAQTFGSFLGEGSCLTNGPVVHPAGILGMAPKSAAAPLDELINSTNPNIGVFAVQACDLDGRLWLGGYDANATTAPPAFVPVTSSTGTWQVGLNGLSIDGVQVPATFQAALVDSGNSGLNLGAGLYAATVRALSADANFVATLDANFFVNGTCLNLPAQTTLAQIDATLPKITLHLDGWSDSSGNSQTVDLLLPPSKSYLQPEYSTDGSIKLCPAIFPGIGAGSAALGTPVQRQFVVIYDNVNKQIGFAPQQGCDAITAAAIQKAH